MRIPYPIMISGIETGRNDVKRLIRNWTVGLWVVAAITAQGDDATRRLAVALMADGDHELAAVEFRRLGLSAQADDERGAWAWLAGYAYLRAGQPDRVEPWMDRAEEHDPELWGEASLLRGDALRARRRPDEAAFYLESVLREGEEMETYARRRLAALDLQAGRAEHALERLSGSPIPHPAGLAAVEHFQAGRDKSPRIGGLLGMIPGFGHFYSGEVANGLRAMILNGIFIYGMVHTAERDQWGAFTALTFFELTWYSGSIYGGIDAAHRYNRGRLDTALQGVEGEMGLHPDWQRVPVLTLEFTW